MVRLEAKPGKEQQVADLIKTTLPHAQAGSRTVDWYTLQFGPSTFGIFDTFKNEKGRNSHLGGQIAEALMDKVPELLAADPIIEKVDILTAK